MTVFTCLDISNDHEMAVEFYIEGQDMRVCKDIFKKIFPLRVNPRIHIIVPKYIPDTRGRKIPWFRLYFTNSDTGTMEHIKSALEVVGYTGDGGSYDIDVSVGGYVRRINYSLNESYYDSVNKDWYAELTIEKTDRHKNERERIDRKSVVWERV